MNFEEAIAIVGLTKVSSDPIAEEDIQDPLGKHEVRPP